MLAGNQARVAMSVVLAMMLAGGAPAKAANPLDAHAWNHPDCPCATVLHEGSAAEAGFVPQAMDARTAISTSAKARRTIR